MCSGTLQPVSRGRYHASRRPDPAHCSSTSVAPDPADAGDRRVADGVRGRSSDLGQCATRLPATVVTIVRDIAAESPLTSLLLSPPCLIGLPYDASSSFLRGPALAPPRIREALRSPAGNSWTERLHDLSAPNVLLDAGDLALGADETARAAIESGIRALLARPARPIALGGDHSVTYPVLRAINTVSAFRRPTILHVDAHADLYDEFEGDRYSHACPFARIMEEGLASRLVQVGIRTLTPHLREQAARFGVEIIDMRAWAAGERPHIDGPVYISIDLDGLDPAFAPGVSHWEPGGLSTREVLGMIQALTTPIVGADVVECNPLRDASGLTATVAAKIVKELASAMQTPAAA